MYFSKYLKEMGHNPIVVTVDEKYASYNQKDYSLLNEIDNIETYKTKSFDLLSAIYKDTKEEPVCAALFKMVAFNYQINRAIPVPSRIVKRCRPI